MGAREGIFKVWKRHLYALEMPFVLKKAVFQLNILLLYAYYICMTRSEFEQMAVQLRTEVLNIGTAFFGNHEDAEDAAQETMIQLWGYCEHIDSGRNVRALAIRIAKNCCVSMHRRRQTETRDITQLSNLKSQIQEVSPQEHLEATDAQRMIEQVIALLKPRERQLFEMRQLEGLSNDDISRETGIPKTSVTAMLSTARKKVFEELTKRMKQ